MGPNQGSRFLPHSFNEWATLAGNQTAVLGQESLNFVEWGRIQGLIDGR